jgi:hypothetical protein
MRCATGRIGNHEGDGRHEHSHFRAVFPASLPAKVLLHIAGCHDLVLCDHIVAELRDVIARKRPDLLGDIDVLLAQLSYELVIAPQVPGKLIQDPQRPTHPERGHHGRCGCYRQWGQALSEVRSGLPPNHVPRAVLESGTGLLREARVGIGLRVRSPLPELSRKEADYWKLR